jgi:hypothetical protein
VKLSCPLWLLSQWEEMTVAELPCHLEATEVAIAELLAQYEEVAVVELPYPLEATEVSVAELLAQYEEMIVAELLVEQEWQSACFVGDDIGVSLNCICYLCGNIDPFKKILRLIHNMN